MSNNDHSAQLHRLKTRWLRAAFWLCTLGAVAGGYGVCALFSDSYRKYLLWDILLGGVASMEAAGSYLQLQIVLLVVAPVLSGMMALCLGLEIFGRPSSGMSLLCTLAEYLVWALNVIGLALGAMFLYRLVRYTVSCLRMTDGGAFPLFAMIIWEGLMLALAATVFFALRRFAGYVCDSAASLAYTLATGKRDHGAIPGFTAAGFLLLGAACLVIAVDQMLTLTMKQGDYAPIYRLVVTRQPAQWASVVGLGLCAAADAVLYVLVSRYKAICEYLAYQERRNLLNL